MIKHKRPAAKYLTPREASLGIAATGRPGAGKSTFLRDIAVDLRDQGCIFHWLTSKPDEPEVANKILPGAIRLKPGDYVFNPLTYELSQHGGSAQNLAILHDDLADHLGRADSSKGEAFWRLSTQRMLTNAFELVFKVKGLAATYRDVYAIISTAPVSLAAAKDPGFLDTACAQFINELGTKDPVVAEPYAEWFMKTAPASGEKAIGAFKTGALNSIFHFVHGPIAEMVNGKSTITPDDMLKKHTVHECDTLTYGPSGLALQLIFSWMLMEAVLRRRGDFPYLVMMRDEYPQFSHERDAVTQSLGRSQKFIGCSSFQTIPGLESSLGGTIEAQTRAKSFYGLHTHKFMFANNCHHTNEINSMVIGQERQMFFGASQQPDHELPWYDVLGVGARPSFNFSQQFHYRVPPTFFTDQLLTGGPENDWTVTAIHHSGADGYQLISIKQR